MKNINNYFANYYDFFKKGDPRVRLLKCEIFSLYEIYDYEVNFNDDVTFIYGDNGCGKTTILDIVTNVITGQIDKLFKYNFDKIILVYKNNEENEKQIIIHYFEDKLSVKYNDEEHVLERYALMFNPNINTFNEYRFPKHTEDNQWTESIKNSFNFIYLPLSRKSTFECEYNEDRYGEFDDDDEDVISKVLKLINNSYMNIIAKLNNVNEQFKMDIFQTVFDSTFSSNKNKTNIDDLNKLIQQNSKEKILKMIEELGLKGEGLNKKINPYFKRIERLMGNNKNDNIQDQIWIMRSVKDIELLAKLGYLADNLEIQKKIYMEPIEKFLGIINEFFDNENKLLKKQIVISKNGNVFVELNDGKTLLNIDALSSGEKQIFIFFAYLIFSIDDKQKGIFIVDEPELSLHLEWQQKYISSILKLNKQIQLIFATHSPEIINKYRKKMYKLIPYKSNLKEK